MLELRLLFVIIWSWKENEISSTFSESFPKFYLDNICILIDWIKPSLS
jgi:hypothetical protein